MNELAIDTRTILPAEIEIKANMDQNPAAVFLATSAPVVTSSFHSWHCNRALFSLTGIHSALFPHKGYIAIKI